MPNAELWWAEFDAHCVKNRRTAILDLGIKGVVTGDQSDPNVLARWRSETGGGFDIIIDDGGHTTRQQWATLLGLWPAIKPGGKLIIEDMGQSRIGMYRNVAAPAGERSMVEIVQHLMLDLLDYGNFVAAQTNNASHAAPSRLYKRYSAKRLPGLESIQCFPEVCVFTRESESARRPQWDGWHSRRQRGTGRSPGNAYTIG